MLGQDGDTSWTLHLPSPNQWHTIAQKTFTRPKTCIAIYTRSKSFFLAATALLRAKYHFYRSAIQTFLQGTEGKPTTREPKHGGIHAPAINV